MKNDQEIPRKPINLNEKLEKLQEFWSPRIISMINDCHIKLAKLQGEFTWHSHADTDEAFLVIRGRMTLQFRYGKVELNEGDLYVVPKGIEHRPVAEVECHVMLVELAGTINTGGTVDRRTAPNDIWI